MLYHFDVAEGATVVPDEEGAELCDEAAARVEAGRAAALALSDAAKHGRCRRTWRLDVKDATGGLVFSLSFADALQPEHLRASRGWEHDSPIQPQ